MPTFRVALICVLAGLTCGPVGCCSGGGLFAGRQSRHQNRLAQRRAWELYRQNQALQQQYGQNAGALGAESEQLRQQVGSLQQELAALKNDRDDLDKRYRTLVEHSKAGSNPLSESATQQLTDLASRYPGFEFDPKTGVSKFSDDVLFNTGSSDIREDAVPLLRDFGKIMSTGTSQELNILVVGHTDDKQVVKAATKSKHVDNWGLSTNRANEVVRMLTVNGVKSSRCGSAGYGSQQPLVPNADEKSRQRNRRVEIFVLAPNASIAGWDNGNVTN